MRARRWRGPGTGPCRRGPSGFDADKDVVSCGRPWLDTEIVIADPHSMQRCPAGSIGEIWVAGASVARGYRNRPELSAETFSAHLTDTGKVHTFGPEISASSATASCSSTAASRTSSSSAVRTTIRRTSSRPCRTAILASVRPAARHSQST